MAGTINSNDSRKLSSTLQSTVSTIEMTIALRLKDAYYYHNRRRKRETISPRRIIYKKCRVRHLKANVVDDDEEEEESNDIRMMNRFEMMTTIHCFARYHRILTANKCISLIILILINQFMQLLGASSTQLVAAAAVASNPALLVDDLLQYNGGLGGASGADSFIGEINGAGSSSTGSSSSSSSSSSDGILISSNLDSDNLNLVNSNSNKSLFSLSLSSNQPITAPIDHSSPMVISGGGSSIGSSSSSNIGASGHYLDKIDNLERSVAAVLIKVAYGTTSTTKRSIPDNSYVPSLTTIATPPLTTLRYLDKSQHQQQINLHHRNYELDLERDHALPTSAPNADILKSNSNPIYPNPNRHHNHDRDRHRHSGNSTPSPSLHSLQKKGPPTNPMYSVDMPSYSPPARSFLTPPLPPEYTNPFADKPTLRGTNNEGVPSNVGGTSNGIGSNSNPYISRRPIPPPSLMPGQERIPLRPPDLNGAAAGGGSGGGSGGNIDGNIDQTFEKSPVPQQSEDDRINSASSIGQRKKALNTPSQKVNNQLDYDKNSQHFDTASNLNETLTNPGSTISASNSGIHFQGISRILSGSNGRKEDIPEVLLRTATVRPNNQHQQEMLNHQQHVTSGTGQNPNINRSKNGKNFATIGSEGGSTTNSSTNAVVLTDTGDTTATHDNNGDGKPDETDSETGDSMRDEINRGSVSDYDENFDMFIAAEPQPKIKMSTKSTKNPNDKGSAVTSTLAAAAAVGSSSSNAATVVEPGSQKSIVLTTPTSSDTDKNTHNVSGGKLGGSTVSGGSATWTVAWNIHVYLSAVLFTILAVYSIFKMIFYDKLTHLFSQSYFICIHLILIIICMTRIFYLCYDAYNIHSSFHIFVSEILLNLPATFLTTAFSVLILFLLIRSLNHKNNRYSALIRPLTVVVGGSVHVGLCITLHYVESYTTTNNQHLYYYQQQLYRSGGTSTMPGTRLAGTGTHHHHHHLHVPPPPPRVLSLICQIIYIFVCLSLGLLYLYLYRILKRVLRSKSQNYIHGYQNLSYAIHITIATALLFVLLAALQIYGALSISTTRPLITSGSEIDWLQWGYQFSLRLIEIAIITLMSWVAGLKTGGNSNVLQREKPSATDTHNVSGFALFPCTSSSSQEHFETDYPAVCNANTNLHTYTLRTGKPIYDDNFALNSLNGGGGGGSSTGVGIVNSSTSGGSQQSSGMHQSRLAHDYQIQNPANNAGDFIRSYETSSLRSNSHQIHPNHSSHILDSQSTGDNGSDFLGDTQTDHYENPNFELCSSNSMTGGRHQYHRHQDNCYSEPTNAYGTNPIGGNRNGYDFQNFERPSFGDSTADHHHHHHHQQQQQRNERSSSRNDSRHMMKGIAKGTGRRGAGGGGGGAGAGPGPQQNMLERSNYENPERRSSNSTHSCSSNRNYSSYNSFDRRNGGVRKSGTLNNIGNLIHNGHGGSGRNNSTSSSSSSNRLSGIQTLNSTHQRAVGGSRSDSTGGSTAPIKQTQGDRGGGGGGSGTGCNFYRGSHHHRSTLERNSGAAAQQQYTIPSSDETDDLCPNPERATLINNSSSSGGSGGGTGMMLAKSTSGSNLTDCCPGGNGIGETVNNTGANSGGGGATSTSSSGGDSANSGCMLVAEHGFVRFRALDDMNNAQGVGIHNASIRTTSGGSNRYKEKPRNFTNNT